MVRCFGWVPRGRGARQTAAGRHVGQAGWAERLHASGSDAAVWSRQSRWQTCLCGGHREVCSSVALCMRLQGVGVPQGLRQNAWYKVVKLKQM